MKYDMAFPYFHEKDIDLILAEFRSILSGQGMLTMGKNVQAFENEFAAYVGAKYAVATNSCTSALEISLKAIGIEKGDEVIVPVQTFIATGSSVIVAGGSVVFCDTDDNFLISIEDLKKKITAKTKAVIIIHFAGLIHPDMMELKTYLKKKGIFLIEDAAHAPGAKIGNHFAGTFGDIGCFSFFSTKIMTTGEGGMIVTNNKDLFEICSSLRNRGLDISAGYEIFTRIGSNRRMTEFQAILGRAQLKRLDQFIAHRNNIAKIYREELMPLVKKRIVSFQEYSQDIRHSYWRFVAFLNKAKVTPAQVQKTAADAGIKIDFPYSPLLPWQPAFKDVRKKHNSFPRAEALSKKHFCMPIHMLITEKDARHIGKIIREAIK